MGAVEPKKPIVKGPAEWFTGDVWTTSLAEPNDDSRLNVGAVPFTRLSSSSLGSDET